MLKIKKGDIFDLYEDGQETRRCMAIEDSHKNMAFYVDLNTIGVIGTNKATVRFAEIENQIENVICNIKDLEDIVERSIRYESLCK